MFKVWTDNFSSLKLSCWRRARRYLLEFIEEHAPRHHNHISKSALKFMRISTLRGKRESKYINPFTTRLLPADPLRDGRKFLPTVIACAPKDLLILPYSIMSVVKNLSGAERLTILTPRILAEDVDVVLRALKINAQVIIDEDLLEQSLGTSSSKVEKAVRMQLLKLLSVVTQNEKEVLVVDGDTLYTKGRNWIHDKQVVLTVSQEFLPRHTNFNRRHLGLKSNSGLGFVTHHQVVCKKCVEDIISQAGGIYSLAEKMQTSFSRTSLWEQEYPSEWQFLGDFMMESTKHKTIVARFANISIDRKVIKLEFEKKIDATNILIELENLAKQVPTLHSISLHSYK